MVKSDGDGCGCADGWSTAPVMVVVVAVPKVVRSQRDGITGAS